MKLEYTKDVCGNDILQDETGVHQVMMEWEKPYMEKCIEYLDPSGSVLEIGFGMGYSAEKLCSFENVTEYTVIECNPTVWKRFETFKKELNKKNQTLKVNVIKGRWEDVLCETNKFDSIFFDDYNGSQDIQTKFRFDYFLYQLLTNKHTKKGTKIGVYSTNNLSRINNSFLKIKTSEYNIDIPEYCKYAKGTKMYIPIITQLEDYDEKLHHNDIKQFLVFNKPCTCNTIIINNFYTNPNQTRATMLLSDFDNNGYTQKTFINNDIGQHIYKHMNKCFKNIINFDNAINGRCKLNTIKNNESIANNTYHWTGILFMTPNAETKYGIETYEYLGVGDWKENINDESCWKVIDTIGNIYNRMVLIPGFVFYKVKGGFGENKNDGSLIQQFYFNTEN